MWFVYASRFNKPDLQTNFSIKFFTYLLISLKLVKELFFVSFERLLRCPSSSVGHYRKVTPSLFGRPSRIRLKINQRTPCYLERLPRCPSSSVGHYHKVTPSLFGRPSRIHLKINQRTLRFSHFPSHLRGSFLNWAAKIRTFLLPANFFATFFKIFSASTEN